MSFSIPADVKIFEVGPRDGLQNEASLVSVEDKIELVNQLSNAGFNNIEVGSFVSPKWIPQMANSTEVFAGIDRKMGVTYSALTPNLKGLHAALDAGVDEIAVFAAASESFSQKNINCSIDESINRFKPIMSEASKHNIPVRGYISCVVGCPYEGEVAAEHVANVARPLNDLGCYEISLGDTIGIGTPTSIVRMISTVCLSVPVKQLAIHCHDTYGQALANIYAALQSGIAVIDSAVAGLGGCPYAKGASGNVATEDVLYLLHGLGIETGIDLKLAIVAGNYISGKMNRRNQSRVAQAMKL